MSSEYLSVIATKGVGGIRAQFNTLFLKRKKNKFKICVKKRFATLNDLLKRRIERVSKPRFDPWSRPNIPTRAHSLVSSNS